MQASIYGLTLLADGCVYVMHYSKNGYMATTLQKKSGCFNHRGVTMVADELEKRGYWKVWKTNCLGQPERQPVKSSYNHNTLTTPRTSVKESLQMHFKVAVRNQMRESQML